MQRTVYADYTLGDRLAHEAERLDKKPTRFAVDKERERLLRKARR